MTKKKRLGIFGGTFNPPHLGHIRAAEAFIDSIKLDELLIMPTFLPPHKESSDVMDAASRLEMCKIAFSHLKNTNVSDFEIKRGGKSYTYITLTELSGEDRELFFLMGTDMFLTLDSWKKPEIICSLANIALIRRESDPKTEKKIDQKTELYKEKYGAKIFGVKAKITEISSTEIRDMILSGADSSEYLSDEIRGYIDKKHIYRTAFSERMLSELREAVKHLMSEERYRHTLGVERAAVKIAEYCAPRLKSELAAAALLHDAAKELGHEELLKIIMKNRSVTAEDIKSPKLYHAFAAPYIIKRDFSHFADKRILSAVFNHTTGRAGMTLFDEIIFVADYIEDTRKYPECIKAREALFSSFDKKSRRNNILALHRCALAEIINTESHLLKKGEPLNSRTAKSKEYIIEKLKNADKKRGREEF